MKLGDSCTTQGFIGTRTLGMPRWHNPVMRDAHLRIWVTSNSISSSVTPDIHPEMTSRVQSSGCCSLNSCLLGSCCDRPQQNPSLTGWPQQDPYLMDGPNRIPTWLMAPTGSLFNECPQQDPYLMGGLGSHHPWSISCCLWGSVPPQLSYKEVCLFLLSSAYEVRTYFVFPDPCLFPGLFWPGLQYSSRTHGSIIFSAFWGLYFF